jgi:hypothetical protein
MSIHNEPPDAEGGRVMNQLGTAVGNRPIAVSFSRGSELTSISKNSLRRLARDGKLRTALVGRRRVIPYNALFELIQNGLGSSEATT